jgi:hypothetical protein
MKNRNLFKKSLALILAAGFLIACGEKEKKRAAIGRRGRTATDYNDVNRRAYDSTTEWPGSITGTPPDAFQQATEGFVSATMDPSTLGRVSGEAAQNTGVRFGGRVSISGGFNPRDIQSNYGTVSSGSLKILIWDEFADSGSAEGIKADPLQVYQGQVNGRSVDVTFEDVHGSITFEGEVDGNWFYGLVWYENYGHFNGGSGESWDWGSFFIPTCDFFECQ